MAQRSDHVARFRRVRKGVLYSFHAKKSARPQHTGNVAFALQSTPPRHEPQEFGAVHATHTQRCMPLACEAPLCPLNCFSRPPAVRVFFLVWCLAAVLRARPEVMAPSGQNMDWRHSGSNKWPGGASQVLGGDSTPQRMPVGSGVLIFLFSSLVNQFLYLYTQ